MAKVARNIKITPRHIVVTGKARASFPNLFKARSFQDNPEEKKEFSIDLIFDPSEIKKEGKTPSLHQAYVNACVDKWGKDKTKWPKFKYGYKDVFRNGDDIKTSDGEPYKGYEGMTVVKAKSSEKYPPKVYTQVNGKIVQTFDENLVYGGCYVQAKIIARPYDFAGNRGVSFKLYEVIFRGDGERFGGVGGPAFEVEETDLETGNEEGDDFGNDVDGTDVDGDDDF